MTTTLEMHPPQRTICDPHIAEQCSRTYREIMRQHALSWRELRDRGLTYRAEITLLRAIEAHNAARHFRQIHFIITPRH